MLHLVELVALAFAPGLRPGIVRASRSRSASAPQMLDVAPSQEPTETVDAACGDSTSWRLLGVVVFACLSLT